MWKQICLLLTWLLVGVDCARTSRPVAMIPEVGNSGPASFDPLAPDDRARGDVSEKQGPRIIVVSATLGENCGLPTGNETANLAKLCDGRRRCDQTVKDAVIPTQWKGNSGLPCRPEYWIEWTCGEGTALHDLKSVRSEQLVSRLRLGCGPVATSLPKVAPSVPKSTAKIEGDRDTVRGHVVTRSGLGLARRKVSLGEQVAISGGDGSFIFQHAPQIYDIKITDRRGWKATAYLGLTRRDPVLVHTAGESELFEGRYHASIAGVLSADLPLPNSHQTPDVVRFLSPSGLSNATERPKVTVEGSRYDALKVRWRGDAVLNGLLVALVGGGTREQPWTSAYLGTTPLSLNDGDAVGVDLNVAPIATGRIAGKVQLLGTGTSGKVEKLTFSYVIPGMVDELDLGKCLTKGDFDCVLPDLTALGGEYCMSIGESRWKVRATQCGGKIGMRDFSVSEQEAVPVPKLGSADAKDQMITWTGEGRVYELNVGYSFAANAHVYTSKTSFSLRDLVKLGLDFARNDIRRVEQRQEGAGSSSEISTISALHPYASVDDLASGRGPMVIGTSWRKATSVTNDVILPASIKVEPSAPPRFEPMNPNDLPTCASPGHAKPVGEICPEMVDTRVALRGILTWDTNWMCTLKGCDCCNTCHTHWIVVDPEGASVGLALQRAEDGSPLSFGALQCHLPQAPRIEVVATGKLFPFEDSMLQRSRHFYLLDEASLCAVRPPPSTLQRRATP